MMNRRITVWTTYLALASLAASLAAPNAALAGSKGRRNTAIGLGAATIHQAVKGKTTNAVILGAGTAYAYKRYRDARKSEKRRERVARAYRSRAAYGGASPRARRNRASTTRTVNSTRSTGYSRRFRHSHARRNGTRYYHTHSGLRTHRH